eukprot:Skav225762  [mRNA]  locus=scaffold3552:182083:184554:+ [translate_table: standard]
MQRTECIGDSPPPSGNPHRVQLDDVTEAQLVPNAVTNASSEFILLGSRQSLRIEAHHVTVFPDHNTSDDLPCLEWTMGSE